MLIYGDQVRRALSQTHLDDLAEALHKVGAATPGIERHGQLVAAFIAAGELAQGVADAEFEARGCDARSPAQDAVMALLVDLAAAIHRSWDSGFADLPALGAERLAHVARSGLPDEVAVKTAEGYAFYALYPESYLAAASELTERPLRVIGIRSIGSGLAALVAAATGAPAPFTVRPFGDPFRRHIKLSHELAAESARGASAHVAIVDEGPGLSGSSFGAVADHLEAAQVAPERIHFFPGHMNDLGPMACAAHRTRWRRARRHAVSFDDLVLGASSQAQRLENWFADLIGPPDGSLHDLSGGRWRLRHFADEADWPPSHVQQERRKFLHEAGGQRWLLKFVGLGGENAGKLQLAQALHAAGFAPEPMGYRHGFLAERWLEDARPFSMNLFDRAQLIERIGRYVGFRARAFPAASDRGASLAQLFAMACRNSELGLDRESANLLAHWREDVPRLESRVRRVRTDNRLHAWEWLLTRDGRLLKTDALDHHAAHDLVGCQDAVWDIAGASIEFDLSEADLARLCDIFARSAHRSVDPDLLAFYRVCYAAFQLGHWSLAGEALGGLAAEAARTRAAADRYRGKLARMLHGA
jgi:hypothetical protein